MIEPRTKFDWVIYADATFAGLSILIPIPLVDLAFEQFFRRRMPGVIAKRNDSVLARPIIQAINRGRFSCLETCLGWPIILLFTFLKRLYRTILYFLTIKEAIDNLSYYWHRAFLLDYVIRSHHLDDMKTAVIAIAAIKQLLADTTTSPLTQLAQQIVASVSHIFKTLRQVVRRGEEDETVADTKSQMANMWGDFADYFTEIAAQYDQLYQELAAAAATTAAAAPPLPLSQENSLE